ncbi:MAG: MFS transporter [Spirulina sp. DLM2.Bin59]|nr:MAG: MFS transporter [Spirulina sp. DLM2.Bin59]
MSWINFPSSALTPELTEDYNERTALNSFRMAFSIGGSILSLVIAQVMFSLYPDDPLQRFQALGLLCSLIAVVATLWCALRMRERGADPILPTTWGRNLGYGLATLGAFGMTGGIVAILRGLLDWYALAGLLLGILLIAFGLTMIFNRPEAHLIGAVASEARSRSAAMPSLPILSQLKVVFNTRPFLYIIGIYLCSWLAVQLTASILIYFVVSWMGMPEEAFPMVAIAVQGTALAMLFVWRPISNRLGKKKVYYMGTAIWIVAQGGLSLLQPGQTGLMYGLAVLAGMGVSVAYLIPWSMVPDVIEYDELHSGQRREGLFYGFMVLLQKLGLAFAVFLVGQGLQLAGFIERLPSQPIPIQPDTALLAIRLVVGPLPIFVLCLGIVLTRFYPITKDYHQEIRQQLAAQRAQSALASQQ